MPKQKIKHNWLGRNTEDMNSEVNSKYMVLKVKL